VTRVTTYSPALSAILNERSKTRDARERSPAVTVCVFMHSLLRS